MAEGRWGGCYSLVMLHFKFVRKNRLPAGLSLDLEPEGELAGLMEFLNRVLDGLERLWQSRPELRAEYKLIFDELSREQDPV